MVVFRLRESRKNKGGTEMKGGRGNRDEGREREQR